MNMRLPLRLLYTMAVVLAVLTTLFLILTMALKISDLLAPSSTSQTKDESRGETTVVEKPESVHDCEGSSALHDVEGMTGRIAYICNGDIYEMNLDTGKVKRHSHGANYLRLDWSSDGEKIAWAGIDFVRLWVTDVGNASPSQQSNETFATAPEWSPNGKTLAFVSAGMPEKRAGLATIPVNGPGFQQKTIISQSEDLDGGSVGGIDWSPDGEKIVFNVDGPPGAKTGLYTVDTDGGYLTRISRPGIGPQTDVRQNNRYWLDPTYSPNGKRIAFIKGWDDWQIYTMNPDGTDARQVTHDFGGYEFQSWSPDGEKILYEYLANGHRDIFVINADGTGRQRLTTVPASKDDLNRIHNVLWLP
jgi:Tol biopolymer transport system component